MLRRMRKEIALVSMVLLASATASIGCSNDTGPVCGEGVDPVIVTGLNGYYEGAPALEVQLRVPETCTVIDRRWLLWDDASQAPTIFGASGPGDSKLLREGVTVGNETILYDTHGINVRLEYPEPGVQSDELSLVWFESSAEDIAAVDCAAVDGPLECIVRAP